MIKPWLNNMFPTLTFNNAINQDPGYSIVICQSLDCYSIGIFFTYFFNSIFGQFSRGPRFTTTNFFRVRQCAITAFCSHVFPIIRGGSKEQVVRTHARRVIAFVKYIKTIWNWPVMQNPRKSGSTALHSFRYSQGTITSGVCSCPQPAIVSFVNKRPKTFNWSLCFFTAPKTAINCASIVRLNLRRYSFKKLATRITIQFNSRFTRAATRNCSAGFKRLQHRPYYYTAVAKTFTCYSLTRIIYTRFAKSKFASKHKASPLLSAFWSVSDNSFCQNFFDIHLIILSQIIGIVNKIRTDWIAACVKYVPNCPKGAK